VTGDQPVTDGHLLHAVTTSRWTHQGIGGARDAFRERARRLRAAKTPHTTDRASLTITYTEPDGTTVVLRYEEVSR
jgi:hypothetical protein